MSPVALAALAAPWVVEVAYDQLVMMTPVAPLQSGGVALRARRALPHDTEVGLTARRLTQPLLVRPTAWELGLSAAMAPTRGAWRPRMGLEVGLSGATHFDWAGYYGAGWREQDAVSRADYGPVWVGVVGEPLRFRWGRVQLSSLGVGLGTMAGGRIARAQLTGLALGVAW